MKKSRDMAWVSCLSSPEKLTAKHMTYALLVAAVFLHFAVVDGRVCTRLTMDKKTVVDKHVQQCTQSYKESCGWFSSEQCTFYEKVDCIKEENRTVTIYRVVEECCPGYVKSGDGKCVAMSQTGPRPGPSRPGASKSTVVPMVTQEPPDSDSSAVEKETRVRGNNFNHNDGRSKGDKNTAESRLGDYDTNDDDDGKFFLGLSHGAYAGIVCGILFLACVALLTALHYRKRRRRQKKMSNIHLEQEVAQQQQQMLPMQTMDKEPTPT